jgi:electron transport complex protein RnfC
MQIAVLLTQHIGAPLKPLVGKKDRVSADQKLADADAFVSAPVHSPFAGVVKDIALESHPVLGRAPAVVIDVDTNSNRQKQPPFERFSPGFDASKYEPQAIKDAVAQAGIIGMGGAGFPTRVKLQVSAEQPIKTMLINGCECEPFITCDYRIMLEWTGQIIAGAKLAARAVGPERVILAIEDNKPQAIEAFRAGLRKFDGIELMAVKTKYPQGGERQLIKAVLKKNVPTAGIPPMIGVLVINVATAAAIAEAVVLGLPLTHRVVTVTGAGVKNPGNFYAPVGMRVAELIELCGGLTDEAVKVVLGGPMMGLAIADLQIPITKTTGAVTVLTAKEIGRAQLARRQTVCIRCGRCLQACPVSISPTRIAHAVKTDMLELAERYYLTACIECGCCSYVCPANIELAGYIKTGKILLAQQKKKMPQ